MLCRSLYEYCLPVPQAGAGVCKSRAERPHYAYLLFLTRTAPELTWLITIIFFSPLWLNEKSVSLDVLLALKTVEVINI